MDRSSVGGTSFVTRHTGTLEEDPTLLSRNLGRQIESVDGPVEA